MKKIIVTVAFAIAMSADTEAQIARIKIKAREAEIPIDIVQAFRKDYRDTEAVEWAIMPATLVIEEYSVTDDDHLNGTTPTVYEVTLRGTNTNSKAVYDQDGVLRYSKETIANTSLPAAVRKVVLQRYPDFALPIDQETIHQGKTHILHYRITIDKANERRVLAVDAFGKILRESKAMLEGK